MAFPTDRTVPVTRRWVVIAVLAGMAFGYTAAVDPVVQSVEQVAYPLVWIVVSAAALSLVPAAEWRSLGARSLLLGGAYTLVLLWTAGLVGPAGGASGLTVHLGIPGWGPALIYAGQFLTVVLVPFLVVGYVTLGALAAVAVRQSWRAAGPGLLGLFACVSCTAPLLAAVAGSLGAGSVAAALSGSQYPVATAVFVATAAALVAIARRSVPACERPG